NRHGRGTRPMLFGTARLVPVRGGLVDSTDREPKLPGQGRGVKRLPVSGVCMRGVKLEFVVGPQTEVTTELPDGFPECLCVVQGGHPDRSEPEVCLAALTPRAGIAGFVDESWHGEQLTRPVANLFRSATGGGLSAPARRRTPISSCCRPRGGQRVVGP